MEAHAAPFKCLIDQQTKMCSLWEWNLFIKTLSDGTTRVLNNALSIE